MIVTLHGMPGHDGKAVAYDTRVLYFQDLLTVEIAEFNRSDVMSDTPIKNIKPVRREIKFKFTHSDGGKGGGGQDHYTHMPNVEIRG